MAEIRHLDEDMRKEVLDKALEQVGSSLVVSKG